MGTQGWSVLIGRATRAAGFTMIEMIVTLSIFSILTALAVPTMRTWIANTKVRAVADSLQNGIRLAQSESLRRSRQVVFALTYSSNPAPNFTATSGGATSSGTYWAVQTVPAIAGEAAQILQTGVLTSAGSIVTITAAAPQSQTAICFNSFGRLVANGTPGVASGTCTTPTVVVNSAPTFWYVISATGGASMWVQVGLGGQLHLCDPTQTFSATNSYGCQV